MGETADSQISDAAHQYRLEHPADVLMDAMLYLWCQHINCKYKPSIGGINMPHLSKCNYGHYCAIRILEALHTVHNFA